MWNLKIFSDSPLKLVIWSIYLSVYLSTCLCLSVSVCLSTCLPVYLSPSLLLGHRPSTRVCQRSCSGPSFLIGSMSGQSFWCQPHDHNARCSLVALSFPYPGDTSKGPDLWHWMWVCKGCALSISIFADWFHLLLVSGCSPSRDLYCWWYCRILLRNLLINVWTFSTVWYDWHFLIQLNMTCSVLKNLVLLCFCRLIDFKWLKYCLFCSP